MTDTKKKYNKKKNTHHCKNILLDCKPERENKGALGCQIVGNTKNS